jgi:thiamine biosynthesis lipoprotein
MRLEHFSGRRIARRRFIAIMAAAATSPALPGFARADELPTIRWEGIVLGAASSLTLQHPDETAARAAIEACLAEAARLEAVFSLFRPDSALARLNAEGRLEGAPMDLRILMAEALRLAEASGGAFDPTVQPLWALYAAHFSRPDAAPDGPAAAAIALVRRLVDWRRVRIEGGSIRFAERGMAVTLNGIAQGYITDRVGDLLRARGFTHVFVDLGEELALGPKTDGHPWRVGIADPQAPSTALVDVELSDGAMATSGSYGFSFDPAGRFGHIIDPATGEPASRWASVTVLADNATTADGLSTALSVLPASAVRVLAGDRARLFVLPTGTTEGYWL